MTITNNYFYDFKSNICVEVTFLYLNFIRNPIEPKLKEFNKDKYDSLVVPKIKLPMFTHDVVELLEKLRNFVGKYYNG